ncbi:MAG: DUF2807 domain-containing protein [Bacteroidota bacterium]
MKILLARIALLCFTALTSSCTALFPKKTVEASHTVSQEWKVKESFDRLSVSDGVIVYLLTDKPQQVHVQTSKNLLDCVDMEVSKGLLQISATCNLDTADKIRVFIKAPDIKSIKTNTKGVVRSQNTLKGEALYLKSSQESHINVTADVKHLYLESSGRSELIVQGNTETYSLKSRRDSNINIQDLVHEFIGNKVYKLAQKY